MAAKALNSNALHLGPKILAVREKKKYEFARELYCGLRVQECMRVEIEASKI